MDDNLLRPLSDDSGEWNEYWGAQGMPWRTEPEIDIGRQSQLSEIFTIVPGPDKGPFEGLLPRLTRADVEWLLGGGWPGLHWVDWSDPAKREKTTIDFTGADLHGADLTCLPLACAIFWRTQLEGAHFVQAHLEGAQFLYANLDGVELAGSYLEAADLTHATLKNVSLHGASLRNAKLACTTLESVDFGGADLSYADLSNARFSAIDSSYVNMRASRLVGANLIEVKVTRGWLAFNKADLTDAKLNRADLEHSDFAEANFKNSVLAGAKLASARLHAANLCGADLSRADLRGADLTNTRMDIATSLTDVCLDSNTKVADVIWNEVPLSRIDWEKLEVLGDERLARSSGKESIGHTGKWVQLDKYETAVRAYRLLAISLRNQGLNEHADRFAYRAQMLQREVLLRQGHWGRAFVSWLLDVVAGYGYRPRRSAFTYVFVVVGFAILYFLLRDSVHPALNPLDALIFSITSFHGRGFNPGESVTLHNPLTIIAAFEAIIGLLIEITFIATFTQRFFAR